MSRPIVVFNCARSYDRASLERDLPRVFERCDVRTNDLRDGAELAAELADADDMVARRDWVGRDSFGGAHKLRGIVTPGVGSEKADVDAATELGIVVANSPGNSVTVSEATLLLMLAVAKQLPFWIDKARNSVEPTNEMHGLELRDKTVGIIGLGRIGKLVAGLARAFGMDVLAYDPYVPTSDLARLTSLEEVLSRSDFVTLHPVLTPETRHMINADRLSLMKRTAFLINTSRGGVIDESALIAALQAGQIAGAGLDVFEVEPPAPNHPLLAMPNVIGTPHGLSHADESIRRCASMTEANVIALLVV